MFLTQVFYLLVVLGSTTLEASDDLSGSESEQFETTNQSDESDLSVSEYEGYCLLKKTNSKVKDLTLILRNVINRLDILTNAVINLQRTVHALKEKMPNQTIDNNVLSTITSLVKLDMLNGKRL